MNLVNGTIPSPYLHPLTPIYEGLSACLQITAASWITTLFCTIIHELGHLVAAKTCEFQVTHLKIGAPLFARIGIPQSFSFETPNKMHLHFEGLNPFPGRIRIAPSDNPSIAQEVLIAASGPLAGAVASGIIYYSLQQTTDNIHPFLGGIRLSSFLFLISQAISLLPFREGSDGRQILQARGG